MLTAERLRELLDYDPETGIFRWRVNRKGTRGIGSAAGGIKGRGYVSIGIDGESYLAHRLAWLYVHGEWPDCEIDHRNQIKTDNRLANLRQATSSQNKMNGVASTNNTTGVRGVYRKRDKWAAQIWVDGMCTTLGSFATKEDAAAARKEAERKYFGDYAPA